MKKVIVWCIGFVLVVLLVATIGASFYMLDYSLSPDPERTDTASCYREQFKNYPETRPWIDSLREIRALRDTFVVMPSGERLRVGETSAKRLSTNGAQESSGMKHHALYISKGAGRTALVLHGWRDCSIDFLWLARLYERELGYNVVIPDLHAHGLSEGDMIQMGWLDRKDALHWLSVFQTDTMVVHGVSMGGATTMMMSAMELPKGIKDIRFIDDCGYTSVWDEFAGELKNQFGLSEFPLMFTTSLLCKLHYGWSFGEASAINEVGKCHHPMLFIHGGNDTFVPTEMVRRLYEAKPGKKQLWIAEGAEHAASYWKHREEYVKRVKEFLSCTE